MRRKFLDFDLPYSFYVNTFKGLLSETSDDSRLITEVQTQKVTPKC